LISLGVTPEESLCLVPSLRRLNQDGDVADSEEMLDVRGVQQFFLFIEIYAAPFGLLRTVASEASHLDVRLRRARVRIKVLLTPRSDFNLNASLAFPVNLPRLRFN